MPGWQQIWQLHRRTVMNYDEHWRIRTCVYKRRGIIDLCKKCPYELSPQIVPLWRVPISTIRMKLYFCEAFLESRTSHSVILLEKNSSNSLSVLLDREHALSFIVYNDVCPTLCIAVVRVVSDATRCIGLLNGRKRAWYYTRSCLIISTLSAHKARRDIHGTWYPDS